MDNSSMLSHHSSRKQICLLSTNRGVGERFDFTHMRGHVRRMFGGEMSFFSLNSDNAFYQLASEE